MDEHDKQLEIYEQNDPAIKNHLGEPDPRRVAQRLKEEGKKQAADRVPQLLKQAQQIARTLAYTSEMLMTSDDVAEAMGEELWALLGNARGSVFSGKKWRWTGQMVPSKRPSSHGRMVKVWRLR